MLPTQGCLRPRSKPAFPPHPVLAQVHEKLGSELAGLEPALQVDVVWALCVLQQVLEAELQAVLHPEFHTRFLGEWWGVFLPLLSDGKPPVHPPPHPKYRPSLEPGGRLGASGLRSPSGRPGKPGLTQHLLLLCPLLVGDRQTLFQLLLAQSPG